MDPATAPTAALFKQWRAGDAASGQAMAQRFSDWYYAVTTCRLGDEHGREPLRRACVRFQQGILSVNTPSELTDWAHGVLLEEVRTAGGRIAGGDFPNQLTQARSPTTLLNEAAGKLSATELRILALTYDRAVPLDQVRDEAEAHGGYPLAVLKARLALKRALLSQASVPFSEVPPSPNLDLGPLPLYEAGRMENEAEESGFEKWMLTNMSLCKDIAEFGVFAQALRAGALRGRVAAKRAPAPVVAEEADEAPEQERSAVARFGVPLALLALAGFGALLVLVAVGLFFFGPA